MGWVPHDFEIYFGLGLPSSVLEIVFVKTNTKSFYRILPHQFHLGSLGLRSNKSIVIADFEHNATAEQMFLLCDQIKS